MNIDNTSDKTGQFLCWGCGEFGQNGHNSSKDDVAADVSILKEFSLSPEHRVKAVSCGSSHTVIVTYSNEIYVWGNGNSGQLGTGSKDSCPKATQILLPVNGEIPEIKGVSCGGRHTFVWLENGQMFSFGNNFYAQLGYDVRIANYKDNQPTAHLLYALSSHVVHQVACGDAHSLFLFTRNTVALVGNNINGQIGSGDQNEAIVPYFQEDFHDVVYIACGNTHNIIITGKGEVWGWGLGKACGSKTRDVLSPRCILPASKNIVMVSGGASHSLALSATGHVYSWGFGSDGQLGHGKDLVWLERPKHIRSHRISGTTSQISSGENFSAALLADGHIMMWGRNNHTIDSCLPSSHKFYEPTLVDTGTKTVAHLVCGAWHAAAITGLPDWTPDENDDIEAGNSDGITDEEQDADDKDIEEYLLAWKHQQEDDNATEASEVSDITDLDIPLPYTMSRQQTTLTIAEFYAPTPTPDILPRSPVPDAFMRTVSSTKRKSASPTKDNVVTKPVKAADNSNSEAYSLATTETVPKVEEDDCLSSVTMPPIQLKSSPKTLRKTKEKDISELQQAIQTRSKTNITQGTTPILSRSSDFSLPRERTFLSNKNIDFLPADVIRTDSSQKSSRFVINKHVPIHMKRTNKGLKLHRVSGSDRRKGRTSSTKRIQDGQHFESEMLLADRNNLKKLEDAPGYTTSPVERALMMPRTVSFICDDEPTATQSHYESPYQPKRHVSIPHRNIYSYDPGANRGSRNTPGLPMFSSSTSWREKPDAVPPIARRHSSGTHIESLVSIPIPLQSTSTRDGTVDTLVSSALPKTSNGRFRPAFSPNKHSTSFKGGKSAAV